MRATTDVELYAGDLTARLVPELGGSLASFRKRGPQGAVDLLRPLSETARRERNPAGAAMFPMLPFANRIAGNRFDFEGRRYEFAPNVRGEPLNLHGTGWLSPWTLVASSGTAVELRLERVSADEPYVYSAVQHFELYSDRLRVRLEIVNRGPRAMPFGFGLHPWWPRYPDTRLRFRARHFWLEGPDHLSTDRISIPSELDFSQGRALPDTWRNNGYSGWDGIAEIHFPAPDIGMRIEAGPVFRHLVLYCDPHKPYFCLEPQTHAIGALNRLQSTQRGVRQGGEEDLCGLIILQPGESAGGAVSFVPIL